MALERQVMFWVAALAVLIAIVWLLSGILLPFIAGMALAYLLDPIALRAERLGIGRAMSALIVVTVVIVVLVVVVMATAPILADQFLDFIDKLPGYFARLQKLISDPSRPWLAKTFGGHLFDPGDSVSGLVAQASSYIGTFLASLWSGGRAVFSVLSLLIITPVVAFYLLCDWGLVVKTVDGWIPLPYRETVRGLARDIDNAIAGFVRGQAVICLILAAFYAAGLTLTGLLIGLATGLLSFIPYVGCLTGFLIAAVVAIAQFWPSWMPMAMVVLPYRAGAGGLCAVAESCRRQGRPAPVWMMFALITFGYLFGFVGLLVAIPLAATIGVLTRFALRKYVESEIYTGGGPR